LDELKAALKKVPSAIVYDVCGMAYSATNNFEDDYKKALRERQLLEDNIRKDIHYSGDFGNLIVGTVIQGPSDEFNGYPPGKRIYILLEKSLG
jgi:hypothetical protein